MEALHGIDLEVNEGEIVTILGANGAGKSTTLNAISGLARITGGGIYFQGKALHRLPAHEIVRLRITQSPEGHRVFSTHNVLVSFPGQIAITCKDEEEEGEISGKLIDANINYRRSKNAPPP